MRHNLHKLFPAITRSGDWIGFGQSEYAFVSSPASDHAAAELVCLALGSDLADINTVRELSFIKAVAPQAGAGNLRIGEEVKSKYILG